MKHTLTLLTALLLTPLMAMPLQANEPGFTPLFDGKTFNGWEHGGNWVIENSAFYRKEKGGSLTYTAATVPDDFELRFEWKVSAGCNSGVYYRPGQVEYQVLDNVGSPYGENARQAAASLFFCMAPSEDATKPCGEWNTGRIVCSGTVIEHWLNGKRVLSFDYADPKWARYVELLGIRGGDLTGRGGRIWLQDHGQDVWFRNLRWRELEENEGVTADPAFEPMPVTGEALAREEARVAGMRAAREAKAPRPNLVWIMADDLGWGDVGCYGSSRIPTPNLDRLAEEGMRFTDAHSPSAVCSPTRYGVLTGTDPFRRYHTSHVLFNAEPLSIRPGEATVASILKDAGYTTAVVGKWHLGLGDEMPRDLLQPGRGPNEVGFDYSFLVPDGHNMFPAYYLENGLPFGKAAGVDFSTRLTLIDRVGYQLLEYKPADTWPDLRPNPEIGAMLTAKAVNWLESAAKQPEHPFFLYLPTCAIHDPQQPDPRFAGKSGMGPHGDYVMQFDWTVGEVLAALDRLGVAKDTLVVVTSDNGGLPGAANRGHDSSGPWRGYKGSAWEGGHRVPFIARWPGRIQSGLDSEALISLTDLAATASALAGGFLPPQGALDSIDQSPVLLGEKKTVRASLMMATRGCTGIVRHGGDKKVILETATGKVRFFNLETNAGEDSPDAPADTNPGTAAEMVERLHQYFAQGASRSGAIGLPGSVDKLFKEKAERNRQMRELLLASPGLTQPGTSPKAPNARSLEGVDPDANTGTTGKAAHTVPPRLIADPDSTEAYARVKRTCTGVPSIAVSRGGRIWAMWYSGTTPGEIIERCPNAYVVVSTSGDGGRTWKEVLAIDPDGSGPLKAFDPQPWIDPDGKLWIIWHHTGVKHAWAITADDAEKENPAWSQPRIITSGIMMNKPAILSNGDWLFAVSERKTGTMNLMKTLVSSDQGRTFHVKGELEISYDLRPCEPMIVERKDGSLWMLTRSRKGISESVSTDGGATWSELKTQAIKHTASRFFITRLQSGHLLLVKHMGMDVDLEAVGRSQRRELMAFLSKDDGKTWSAGLMLDDRNGISYPDGQQTADGTIHLIWDYSRSKEQEILMTTFREEDVLVASDEAASRVKANRKLVSKGGTPE